MIMIWLLAEKTSNQSAKMMMPAEALGGFKAVEPSSALSVQHRRRPLSRVFHGRFFLQCAHRLSGWVPGLLEKARKGFEPTKVSTTGGEGNRRAWRGLASIFTGVQLM